ncbi:class I SAM-dependent RNA methyltransferase [Nocardia sp. SYP-A9097]|uniref:class I SAM-dependent RNA methyltransferase n=1 Tax=Nocardia sp. SYP-A9097 TaxID=2663237 RepID=UPI0013231EA3|nr:TRAM domain-containing protein [Nocardia sp. SYP-A9097]MRH89567.1 class I SAM-dependent RNA methyltransferase [Nocardia sp. SYP-A9097]
MSSGEDWRGSVFEVRLGPPGHGGFCVARHEGRVLFVRHGLPGELVRARVTEDRGGSFCRADAIEILEASADRIDPTCPVSGPGGAGCCDFAHASPEGQRGLKAAVVSEQLRRLADWETDFEVEAIPAPVYGAAARLGAFEAGTMPAALGGVRGIAAGRIRDFAAGRVKEIVPQSYTAGWRSRVRLVVDANGRAGVHGYRSTEVIADLRCPQPMAGAMEGIADRKWTPGADLVVAVDGDGMRHLIELAPVESERGDRNAHGRGERNRGGRQGGGRGSDRSSAAARRAAAAGPRHERLIDGSGRAVQYVSGRRFELSATGFWQPHYGAAQCYSDVVGEWADAAPGALAWDLYSGVGVFAAGLGERVGADGVVHGVEFARTAVTEGKAALRDLPWVELRAERVERWIVEQSDTTPDVVVLDPPRAGAGKEVIAALGERGPRRIVHIGCDPAAFARDVGLYRTAGYRPSALRVFDAFPGTHHVECIALLER